MFAKVIKECVHHAKSAARRFPPLATANRIIKARQLRTGLRELARHYAFQATQAGVVYDETQAWAISRERITKLRSMAPAVAGRRPRIFWVGANLAQDESGFLQALRALADVTVLHNARGEYGQWYWDSRGRVSLYDRSIVALNDQCLLQQLDAAQQGGAVDLLMGQMWANYISVDALAQVRARGVPVVNISMDDRFIDNWGRKNGTRLGAVGLAPATDLVLTTSSEACDWYAVERCPAVFWPLASDPDVFAPAVDAVRDIDVLFIGGRYGIRERIIGTLTRAGLQIDCFGAGWPNGMASVEQAANLFKRARIVLGFGTVGHCEDVFQMKLRDFDAPMSGALYLTHRSPDLARLYREDVEIVCYETGEEAVRKIRYYLENAAERSAIAAAGHAKALMRDTWLHRLQSTLDKLGVLGSTMNSHAASSQQS